MRGRVSRGLFGRPQLNINSASADRQRDLPREIVLDGLLTLLVPEARANRSWISQGARAEGGSISAAASLRRTISPMSADRRVFGKQRIGPLIFSGNCRGNIGGGIKATGTTETLIQVPFSQSPLFLLPPPNLPPTVTGENSVVSGGQTSPQVLPETTGANSLRRPNTDGFINRRDSLHIKTTVYPCIESFHQVTLFVWRVTVSILRWPWRKIIQGIIKVASWILNILPDDPPKPPDAST
jgi:hypothetical protein